MAVPTSGILYLEKLAREAYYADYNGSQNVGTVSLYDIVNGGQAHGSTLNYPALNRNCLPNPTGSLPNSATEPCSQGLDVCFIIDYTASMGNVIETVKTGASSVIAHINTESSSNYRLSLMTVDEMSNTATPCYSSCSQYTSLPTAQKYNNNGSGNKYQIITAWEMFPTSSTNNGTSFTNILDDLNGSSCGNNTCIQLGAGASGPEPMDIGLGLVINSTNFVNNFRTTAAKYIIMLTDAPPSGPDDAFTEADYNQVLVYAATCVFRGIKVFVLGLGVNSFLTVNGTARYPWRELATQTGGTWDITYDTTDVEADITVACDNDGTFTPYKFSAWYGYDKDCTGNITSFNSSTIQTSTTNACAATITQTYYHNGSGSSPVVGDECYINQNQTTALAEGYYKLPSGSGYRVTGTSGTVASLFACVTLVGLPITATNYSKPGFSCYQTTGATAYFPDISPAVGDVVYSDSAGTTFQGVGFWGVNILDTQSNRKMTIGSNGVITSFSNC
tara:strand:+ start:34 stop:1545 length:1512 start_codon:yes stop_codon:yes gene_type:complete